MFKLESPWGRTITLSNADKLKLEETLIKYLGDCGEICSANMGTTTFLGLPVSRLVKYLRQDGWQVPGHERDHLALFAALGAESRKARVKGYGAGNSWQRECTIVYI